MEHILYTNAFIPFLLDLKYLFHLEQKKNYKLYGIFLFYNNHYICFFYENKLKKFEVYDDENYKIFEDYKTLIEY